MQNWAQLSQNCHRFAACLIPSKRIKSDPCNTCHSYVLVLAENFSQKIWEKHLPPSPPQVSLRFQGWKSSQCQHVKDNRCTEMELWGNGRNESYKKTRGSSSSPIPYRIHVWYIFLHESLVFYGFQGKYKPIRPMDPSWIKKKNARNPWPVAPANKESLKSSFVWWIVKKNISRSWCMYMQINLCIYIYKWKQTNEQTHS